MSGQDWSGLEVFMSEAQRVAYGVGGAFSEDQAALVVPRAVFTANAGPTRPPTVSRTDAEPMTPPAKRDPVTYSCGGCDTRWSGVSRCHCSGCHRTFAGLVLFDSHRRIRGEAGYCVDPATITTKKGEATQVYRDGLWRSTKEFSNAGELFR